MGNKKLKREMDETLKKLVDEGRFDDAQRYAEFIYLMKKSTDIDFGFIFLMIGLSMMIIALTTKLILSFIGIEW